MSEKNLELRLKRDVNKRGGWCVKLNWIRGMPDRLIILPGARVWFRELKTWGKVPSKLQESRLKKLRSMGFNASAILSEIDYLNLLKQFDGDL